MYLLRKESCEVPGMLGKENIKSIHGKSPCISLYPERKLHVIFFPQIIFKWCFELCSEEICLNVDISDIPLKLFELLVGDGDSCMGDSCTHGCSVLKH